MHKYPFPSYIFVSKLKLSCSGYACFPYLHDIKSIELKDFWMNSKNIESLFFVTGTFSNESESYFSNSNNHFLLAKFKDDNQVEKDLTKFNQEKTSFVFSIKDEFFQREIINEPNFVTVYYLQYRESEDDSKEIANILLRREKIVEGGIGTMNTYCTTPSKFTFPYSDNIVVIEVASEKSHQSVRKYCDQTKRDVNRKGLTMTNLVSLSILEKLK